MGLFWVCLVLPSISPSALWYHPQYRQAHDRCQQMQLLKRLFGIKPEDLSGNPVVVKVECKRTSQTVDAFDCGTNATLAARKRAEFLKKYPEATHHVYESYTNPVARS